MPPTCPYGQGYIFGGEFGSRTCGFNPSPPPYIPPAVTPGVFVGQTYPPPPSGVLCPNGVREPTVAQCQQPPQQTAPSTSPQSTTPPPPVSISYSSSGSSVTITFHFNQTLTVPLTGSIDINLAPGVQATSATTSAGQAIIQGSQVIVGGFTAQAGQDVTVSINLAATAGSATTTSGSPAVQSISIQALDVSGTPVFEDGPGGGQTVGSLPPCSTTANPSATSCSGTGTEPGVQVLAGGDVAALRPGLLVLKFSTPPAGGLPALSTSSLSWVQSP